MAVVTEADVGADWQPLWHSANALTGAICPEHAADDQGSYVDVDSAASIEEHMQQILLRHKALHASGVKSCLAGQQVQEC